MSVHSPFYMRRVVVAQSGGPTSAINATLAGVISAAYEAQLGFCLGAKYGLNGIIKNDFVDLFSAVPESAIPLLCATPSAALGSCRMKLPALDNADGVEIYERIFQNLLANGITDLLYIGGNDSMDSVIKLASYAAAKKHNIHVIGLPKTIDNDLLGTDHTPGYGSAAKYIATTMGEIACDCAAYNVPAVTIVEIMGRDAGWLSAAAGLANPVPDLIYMPERTFSLEKFYIDIKGVMNKKPNIVIAVSEGLRFEDGTYVGAAAQSGVMDVFGHAYLAGVGKILENYVKDNFGIKTRSFELSLPQRCAGHLTSKTDINEAFEIGKCGLEFALMDMSNVMPSILRIDDEDEGYKIEIVPNKIDGSANMIKRLPDDFINARGNGITKAFISYARPLIAGEGKTFYNKGVPKFLSLF